MYAEGKVCVQMQIIVTDFQEGTENKYETFQSVCLVDMPRFKDRIFVIRSCCAVLSTAIYERPMDWKAAN